MRFPRAYSDPQKNARATIRTGDVESPVEPQKRGHPTTTTAITRALIEVRAYCKAHSPVPRTGSIYWVLLLTPVGTSIYHLQCPRHWCG